MSLKQQQAVAAKLEVTDADVSLLVAFVDDGDGVLTIPHFDALMRKARKSSRPPRAHGAQAA